MPPKPIIPRPTVTSPQASQSPSPIETPEATPALLTIELNEFGVYRVYMTYLSTNLDEMQDLESRCDAPGLVTASRETQRWLSFGWVASNLLAQKTHKKFFAPFLNATVFHLMS